jgi:polyphosphate glucokinase
VPITESLSAPSIERHEDIVGASSDVKKTNEENQRGKRHERDVFMNGRPVSRRQADTAPRSPVGKASRRGRSAKRVLVIDVGGTSVKILATGQTESRSFRSGPRLTPRLMASGVSKLAGDWIYDAVSIGYPGPVLGGRPAAGPVNLGRGWVGFDFEQAFGPSVQVINDAAMQALGSYRGGKMLFLGLGTGLGADLSLRAW